MTEMQVVAKEESRSPLSFPMFRAVWIANMTSNLGALIQVVGASWMMIAAGGSPQMVALVQTSMSLPIMLLSLAAGAMADNLERRRVMMSAQLFLLLVSMTLATLAWLGNVTPWLLLTFTFLVGCGTAINGPSWQASVGDLVPRPVLPHAVTYNAMGMNIARSLGPAAGGAIVAAAGAAAAFLVNGLSTLGLLFVLRGWRPDYPPRQLPRERLAAAMQAGLRYMMMSPHIGVLMLRAALFGCAASAIQALLPLVARDLLDAGPLTFGLLLGAFGMGAVASAMMTRRIRLLFSPEMILRAASMFTALAALVSALSGTIWLTAPLLALAGIGWVLAFSTINVGVQLASPRWVVGRALSLYQMAVYGGFAGGSWLSGYCANHVGTQNSLFIAAAANLAVVGIALLIPVPPFNEQNLDPSDPWQKPDTAVPVEDRSGPIAIIIEHRVPADNVIPFLATMAERRRIRLRDGARRWSLFRDLSAPEKWVESYHFPTWLAYIRHNSRRTRADEANGDALRALRVEGQDPVVHRMIERQTSSLPLGRRGDPHALGDPVSQSH